MHVLTTFLEETKYMNHKKENIRKNPKNCQFRKKGK